VNAIILPFPPSLNNSKTPVKGRMISSTRYRAWRREAWGMIKRQGPAKIKGGFRIAITVTRPDRRRRDLDNLTKPCLDALVSAGVVEDDCLAESILTEWARGEPVKGGGVSVTLEPFG
jgi:crossover junction endodeoxyribonuclease RusA